MESNQDINIGTGGLAIVQMCRRLMDKEFVSADFSMFPLSKIQTSESEEHIADGIMVGVVCGGTIRAVVNDRRFELRRNNLLLLQEGAKIESLKCSKASSGYVFAFSRRFLDNIDVSVDDLISARVMFHTSPCVAVSSSDATRLHNIALALADAAVGGGYIYEEKIISSLFSAFFYTLASVLSSAQHEESEAKSRSRGEALIEQFTALLEQMCYEQRSVEYYAARMGITPKYLSLICKSHLGQSASKVIDEVVIRKAKEMLGQSGVSVSEVAVRLNFVTQSFFGKYFKQRVGMSPSRYKSQLF